MPRRKTRKPRGSRGVRSSTGNSSIVRDGACDMMVLLPSDVSDFQSKLQIKEIMDRLASTGFSHMALTHTIYGRPRPTEDRANVAIPTSLWSQEKDEDKKESTTKKRKTSEFHSPNICILRRLHAVLENLSDVGVYLSNSSYSALLNEYDIVSVSPRNEATFQSACASATAADIITLDYTIRGMRLPYRIRPADVKAVANRNAAFELTFAPALLNGKQRRALVQTCRELQNSSLEKKPYILFSSGNRAREDSDAGALALRMPGDLTNLLHSVLHFDPSTASKAVGAYGLAVLKRAEDRRWGKTDVATVGFEIPEKEEGRKHHITLETTEMTNQTGTSEVLHTTHELGIEDGFISMP